MERQTFDQRVVNVISVSDSRNEKQELISGSISLNCKENDLPIIKFGKSDIETTNRINKKAFYMTQLVAAISEDVADCQTLTGQQAVPEELLFIVLKGAKITVTPEHKFKGEKREFDDTTYTNDAIHYVISNIELAPLSDRLQRKVDAIIDKAEEEATKEREAANDVAKQNRAKAMSLADLMA